MGGVGPDPEQPGEVKWDQTQSCQDGGVDQEWWWGRHRARCRVHPPLPPCLMGNLLVIYKFVATKGKLIFFKMGKQLDHKGCFQAMIIEL